MSYSDAKYITPGTDGKQTGIFSGGYVDNTQDLYLADMYSPYLRNARLDGNSIIIRPGHSIFEHIYQDELSFATQISDTNDDGCNTAPVFGADTWLNTTVSVGLKNVAQDRRAIGLRFQNVTIPQGSVITSAKIILTASETDSGSPSIATIYGADYDNFSGFSNSALPYDAGTAPNDLITITTANTNWTIPSIIIDTEYETSDISEIVQEIVDRFGWSSGNAMAFAIQVSNFDDSLQKAFYDYSTDPAKSAQLEVTYTAPVTGYPKGIGSYLRTISANDRLVIRQNIDSTHKLVTLDEDGNKTTILTNSDIASDNRMIFSNIADVIYCMNGSDNFGKLNGTTYTAPSTGISNFAPSFAVVFNGSHWASGWATNPNKVYKSVADNYEDFNSTGSDSFTFQETITGLSANNEALFYFTKNSISVTGVGDITDSAGIITYSNRTLQVKEGAVNHSSIIEAGSNIYFLTPSNKINRIAKGQNVDGFEVYELSERKYAGISTIMSSLDNNQSDSFGYYLPKENLIKWFVKTNGATFNDLCIVYDITKDKFLIDGQKFFYDGIHFKGNNYTVSMLESKVYLDEYGQDDEDTAIPFEYWTNGFYISDPTMKKTLWESRTLLDINELAELTQTIWIDGVQKDTKTIDNDNIPLTSGGIGTLPVGTYAIGTGGVVVDEYTEVYILRTKGNLNLKGRKIQFRFTNNTLAGKIRLKNIMMKIELLPELATNLTT